MNHWLRLMGHLIQKQTVNTLLCTQATESDFVKVKRYIIHVAMGCN